MMALHHLAGLTIDPRGRMTTWLSTWAPWMPPGEAAGLIERAIAKPTRYRADTLARRLNLHLAERTLLNVTTIGAVDKPKKQRDAERRERNRLAKEKQRRARGAKPRAIYCGSKGNVKWFNAAKGYGFIQPAGGGKDVFVHISAVERAGLSSLNEGQTIEFEVVENRGKSSAEN